MEYRALSDKALLARLREMASRERTATAEFVACLAEVDRRSQVVLGQGFPSLFDFCVRDLKLAESTAYHRVKAARLARSKPEILSLLADGSVNLSALCVIAPELERDPALLQRIRNKSKREVEALLAGLGRSPEKPDRVRLLAPRAPAPVEADLFSAVVQPSQPPSPPSVAAMPNPAPIQTPAANAPPRIEYRFSAGQRFAETVERLRALLWHQYPAGRLEDVLLEAAADFVRRRDPSREGRLVAAAAPPPDPRSRRIPARVRRQVWRRDQSRCAFCGPAGRCSETRGLEIDHVTPWALGGRSDDAANLRLLCRAHNQSEAARLFGESVPKKSLTG